MTMFPEHNLSDGKAAEPPDVPRSPLRQLLTQWHLKYRRKLVIALPYIWLILLFILPFLIVFKISLAEMAGGATLYRFALLGG